MRANNLQLRVGTDVKRRVKNDGAVCWAIPSRIAPCVVDSNGSTKPRLLDTHQSFPYDHLSLVSHRTLGCLKTGTYVNGRRLPLQGRGWGFESLRAHQDAEIRGQRSEVGPSHVPASDL